MSTEKIKSLIAAFGVNLHMHKYIGHLRGQSSGSRLTNCFMTMGGYKNLSGVEDGMDKKSV